MVQRLPCNHLSSPNKNNGENKSLLRIVTPADKKNNPLSQSSKVRRPEAF